MAQVSGGMAPEGRMSEWLKTPSCKGCYWFLDCCSGRCSAGLLLVLLPCLFSFAAGETDEALLLGFKANFTNGAQVLADWLPGTDPCSWTGIACLAGQVQNM